MELGALPPEHLDSVSKEHGGMILGCKLMVPAKTCILDFDRYCQIVLYRDWASLHSHQQYVRASVSLTSIHMVLSKFLSANLVVLNCISLIMGKVEHIFICLKAIWNSLPGNCLFISFAHFRLSYWSLSYWFVGMQIVVSSFSCLLSLFLVFFFVFFFLSRILKKVFRHSFPFIAPMFYIMLTKAFPTPRLENNPVFSSRTFRFSLFHTSILTHLEFILV